MTITATLPLHGITHLYGGVQGVDRYGTRWHRLAVVRVIQRMEGVLPVPLPQEGDDGKGL